MAQSTQIKYQSIYGKSASLDQLKAFVAVPFFIEWYRSSESRKVFPIFLNEMQDINASNKLLPSVLGKNPFFEHTDITFIIAKEGEKPVGRIAAFIDHRYNSEHDEQTGWIGMFESTYDSKVGSDILNLALDNLRAKGCTKVIGPAKFNANGEAGLLIEGFEYSPFFMEPYNAPYYRHFFEDLGFKKEDDWYSFLINEKNLAKIQKYMARIGELKKIAEQTSLGIGRAMLDTTIRQISFKNLSTEIALIEDIYNKEWGKGNHPQFVTMNHSEMQALAKGIKMIALEDLVLVAERKGEPVGVAVTVPNINEVISLHDSQQRGYYPSPKFIDIRDMKRDLTIFSDIKRKVKNKDYKSARVLILGVREEYKKSGIDALLYHETFKRAIALGIREVSGSQIAEKNIDMISPLERMAEKAMTWRVYSLDL